MAKSRNAECPECGTQLTTRQMAAPSARCRECGADVRAARPAKAGGPPAAGALGGCCGLVALAGLFGLGVAVFHGLQNGRKEAEARVTRADRLYERGDKAAAVA